MKHGLVVFMAARKRSRRQHQPDSAQTGLQQQASSAGQNGKADQARSGLRLQYDRLQTGRLGGGTLRPRNRIAYHISQQFLLQPERS